MTMLDLAADLQIFYDKHVRLGADRRKSSPVTAISTSVG